MENNLHWCLDISFADDERRIRKGHGAENFARLSRIALNLLKAQTKHRAGIKTKRLRSGWDHDFLLLVLTGRDEGVWEQLPWGGIPLAMNPIRGTYRIFEVTS